jgi:succinoglycan biosynthesis protein ExoA
VIDPAGRTPIVIPTLNEAAHIAEVIRALDDPAASGGGYHFVVADGGSTDGTAEAALALNAEGRRVEVLPNPKRLQSAAVNLAVAELAPGVEVFVRCDAHGGYPPGFIARLLASLAREGADSVVVSMDSVGETCLQKAIAWVSNTPVGTGGSAHRAGAKSGWVDHGHHAVFRVGPYRQVGGYDERQVANEDAELDARLRAAGARIWLDAEARMLYFPRRTFGALARQYYRYGFGRAFTVLKHPKSLRPRQLAVPANLLLVLACLSLSPWLPLLLLWPAFYLFVLAATSLALTLRHRSPCGLLAGPAALVMHTAWAVGFLQRMAAAVLSRS